MKVSQKLFDIIPKITITNPKTLKKLNKIGDIMGRPMPNRFIMGATALITQPYIESKNKKIDADTANTSRNRIIGKVVAGTAVGCLVRQGVTSLIKLCTNEHVSQDSWGNLLTPRHINKLPQVFIKNKMRNYRTAMATIIAMFVMLATNVLFDVPLTNLIANTLNEHDTRKKTKTSEDIKQKMLNSFNHYKAGGKQ